MVFDVLVVGGGVIGAAIALELARSGARVALAERDEIGRGCSYGNAGWLTPSLATPLPAPGVVRKALRWMLDPESPLYIKPAPSLALFDWLLRFALSARREKFERGTAALVSLSRWSLEAYEKLDRELGGSFGFERRGLVVVAQSPEGYRYAQEEVALVSRFGVEGQLLDENGVRAEEPAVRGAIEGGAFFPHEAHVEPFEVVRAMASHAEKLGAVLLDRTEVFGFDRTGGKLEAALTTRGRLRADRYVLAAGAWSRQLGQQLGLKIPVLGGKGYAVVVKGSPNPPRRPIKLVEKRIAITPRRESLRLAGTLELVDSDRGISPRRVEAILRGSREVLNLPEPVEIVEIWRGLRPCTPDGLPIIGFVPRYPNLLVATGHQMLGLHTAPATGRLVADLLVGAKPEFDPAVFRPDRF
jgi:D-amino-acid dehydrogenase